MIFFINEFSILSPLKKKAFNLKLKPNINVIVGKKDTGKSTLARSILYTLGCDVKGFDLLHSSPENIYILDFNIEEKRYILIRRRLKTGKGKNYFKIAGPNNLVKTFYDTTSFKDELNMIFNIQLTTIDKKNKETKLFPNHIFLPFYTDQDYSWQNYLTDTFNGTNFIADYKKLILEYFTGARSNNYYNLRLQKIVTNNELQKCEALIKSKELIIKENLKNIKILEDIDIEQFKKNYEAVLKIYNSIIETEHELKENLNEKIYEKNVLTEMKESISNSLDNMIEKNLNSKCPTCNQKVINDMEDNYRYLLARENLLKEREKIRLSLVDVEKEINSYIEQLKNINPQTNQYEEKLNADANVVSTLDRADSYALSRINIRIEEELKGLKESEKKHTIELKNLEENLKKLNSKDVSAEYKRLMIEAFNSLDIQFAYKNYYNSNLESVKIALSGASKVQAFIAQYLTIYEMTLKNKEIIKFPMFIDTFLKDDFNNIEIYKTARFIFSKLQFAPQSFIFISDNQQTLEAIEGFNFNRINLKNQYNLFNQDYKEAYGKYKVLLEE